MNITEHITLDFHKPNSGTLVRAKQGDNDARYICITLTGNDTVYKPPEGATAGFRCLKPDGCSCDNPAVINEDGTITVELTEQVLAAHGHVWADLYLNGPDGQRLSSLNFRIYSEFVPQGQNIPSTNEFLALVDMVSRGEAVLKELGGAEGGSDGADGATFVPSVSEEGVLSWTNNAGLPNPEPVNIRGPQGEKGEKGDKGDPGEGGGSGEGGVSSWNDLEDKPFSEELGMVALFDEQEVTGFQIHSVYQLPFKAFTPSPFLLIPGETYQVRWNDTVWNCTAIDGNTTIPGAVGIGNGYLFGQPDTGEPFAIVTFATTNELGICPLDGSETVNVGIFQEGMVVTPLDAKYLPMEAIDARIEEIINAALEGDY